MEASIYRLDLPRIPSASTTERTIWYLTPFPPNPNKGDCAETSDRRDRKRVKGNNGERWEASLCHQPEKRTGWVENRKSNRPVGEGADALVSRLGTITDWLWFMGWVQHAGDLDGSGWNWERLLSMGTIELDAEGVDSPETRELMVQSFPYLRRKAGLDVPHPNLNTIAASSVPLPLDHVHHPPSASSTSAQTGSPHTPLETKLSRPVKPLPSRKAQPVTATRSIVPLQPAFPPSSNSSSNPTKSVSFDFD